MWVWPTPPTPEAPHEGVACVLPCNTITLERFQFSKPTKRTKLSWPTKHTNQRRKTMFKIHPGNGKRDIDVADEMCRAIKAAVYQFKDRVPLATAIGVLEIAKREILEEH